MREITILYPHPAIMIQYRAMKYLVVSDLHIGFEEKLKSSGVQITISTKNMLDELLKIVDYSNPDYLIILGDVKSSIERINFSESKYVPDFLDKISNRVKTIIIPGNHDGNLTYLVPQHVKLHNDSIMRIGENILTHGHATIPKDANSSKRIIIGHLHPTYNQRDSPVSGSEVWTILRGNGSSIFKEVDKDDLTELIIIPAFNRELSVTGFSTFRNKDISPILRRFRPHICEAFIITLNGEIIGDLNSLKYVI